VQTEEARCGSGRKSLPDFARYLPAPLQQAQVGVADAEGCRSSCSCDYDAFAAAPDTAQSSGTELPSLKRLADGCNPECNIAQNGSRARRRQDFQPEFFRYLHNVRDTLLLRELGAPIS